MLDVIVIGGSAGALDPMFEILTALSRTVTAPVVIVMHVLPNQPSLIPELIQRACPDRSVREPDDKEPLAARTIYVAAPNYHLLIERDATFSLSVDDPVNFSRPSIDVLFESAAEAFGPRLVAILMSGSNADGATGLAAVARARGTAIVQAGAEFSAMPDAGRTQVPNAHVLDAPAIAHFLARHVSSDKGTFS